MIFLERTKQDFFSLAQSNDIDSCSYKSIIDIDKAFSSLKSLQLDSINSNKFSNGAIVKDPINQDGIYKVYNSMSTFLGLGLIENKALKSKQLV